ncbi:MAG: phospholipid scramblase-related protein [Myxococcota bacterium]
MTAHAPESLSTSAPTPGRSSLLAGLAVGLVGAVATFYLSAAAGEVGGAAARGRGEAIALAGAISSVLWAIVAARFARGLATAARWANPATRRLAVGTPVVALTSAVAAAAATWSSLDAAVGVANHARESWERRLEIGATEAFVAGVVGVGLFFIVLRAGDASPTLSDVTAFADDDGDAAAEPAPRRRALVAAGVGAITFVVVTLGLGHALAWAGFTAAAVSLAAAAVVYETVRPTVAAEASWPRVRAGVAASLGGLGFIAAHHIIAIAYAMNNASLRFDWDRQAMGPAETGIAGAIGAAIALTVLVATRSPLATPRLVRRLTVHQLVRAGIAVGTGFGLAAVAVAYFEGNGFVSLAAGGVAGATLFLVTRPSLQSMAGDDGDVGEALGQLDRAHRRSQLALVGAGGVGLAVLTLPWAGLSALDVGGVGAFMGIVAASAASALLVHRRLAAPPGDASYEELLHQARAAGADVDIFSDALERAPSIELSQNMSLAALLTGGATRASYQLGTGDTWCGEAQEKSGLLSRIFLGGRRALDIEVGDGGDAPSMRLERPFVWWRNRAKVWVGDRAVGTIVRRWSPFRRRYVVQDADGQAQYTLVSGAVLWWRRQFAIVRRDHSVGAMKKLLRPWYRRWFRSPLATEPDRFHLELPEDADLDARRLLVGATLLVDVTHYPITQNARVGGLVLGATVGLLSLMAPPADDGPAAAIHDDDGSYAPPAAHALADPHRPQTAWEGRPPGVEDAPAEADRPVVPGLTGAMRGEPFEPTGFDDTDRPDDAATTRPEFADTEDAVAQVRAAPKADRLRLLALALEHFSRDLYGRGYAAMARALAKTRDDDRLALAILPRTSRHLAARGCLEAMRAAMEHERARELTTCRPDGAPLPLPAAKLARAKLWAAALALDLQLKAREQETERDPLHRLAVKALLAQR